MPKANDSAAPFSLLLTPGRSTVPAGRPSTLQLLVRVQAPAAPAGVRRPPLHLALVLDRSGSMSGQPLDEAKRCARHILDSLAAEDRVAIFAFDDTADCIAPLTPAADKLALATALATIESGGCTNLHGGWSAGADALAARLAGTDVHRVVLLSDGCANEGETRLEPITGQCKAFAQKGVSTSTYGLGRDFNEELMLAMAAAGRGNAYYGQTAADLADPFAEEFALLTSLAARGLVLKVKAPAGVAVRLRNDYPPVDGEPLAWQLPDLAFAAEAWALLEVDVPAAETPVLDVPLTLSVQAAAQDATPLYLIGALPSLPVVAPDAWEASPVDASVARRAIELDAADALLAVRDAVSAGDWALARELVDAAAARYAGHPWAAAILATMRRLVARQDARLVAKESLFARRKLNVRLAAHEEGSWDAASERGIPAFLRRKREQGRGDDGGPAFRGDGGDGQHGA
jgi:Ca-activated chloride channel family protein